MLPLSRLVRFGRDRGRAADGPLSDQLLSFLADVATEAIDLPSVLEAIAQGAVVLLDAPAGALVLLAGEAVTQVLAGPVIVGDLSSDLVSHSPICEGANPLARTARDSQDVVLATVEPSRRNGPPSGVQANWTGWPTALSAVAVCPIAIGSDESAVLVLARSRAFSSTEVVQLKAFGRLAGTVADRVRLRLRATELIDQAATMERARGEFVARVTHELRTPLASIKASADLLRDMLEKATSPTQIKLLRNIARNVDRLNLLVEDLLSISHLRVAALRFDAQVLDLRPLLGQAVSVVAPIARARHQTIEIAANGGPLIAEIDQQRFEQVLVNLLNNASRFSPQNGHILMTARTEPGTIVVEIEDDGPGIPPGELGLIFEPFYRGNAAKTSQAPGSGLGLAIAKSLVEMHRGRLQVRSVVGKGSTFSVILPAVELT